MRRILLPIINNYFDAAKLNQTVYDDLINSFNELYNEMNEYIIKNHDKFQLEMDEYTLCINDETKAETDEKSINVAVDLKKKIRTKWLILINDNNENYNELTCEHILKCKMVKRIAYLLKLYKT
eukprot:120728_1